MFVSSVSEFKILQKNICLHKCPLTYEMHLEVPSETEFSGPLTSIYRSAILLAIVTSRHFQNLILTIIKIKCTPLFF